MVFAGSVYTAAFSLSKTLVKTPQFMGAKVVRTL